MLIVTSYKRNFHHNQLYHTIRIRVQQDLTVYQSTSIFLEQFFSISILHQPTLFWPHFPMVAPAFVPVFSFQAVALDTSASSAPDHPHTSDTFALPNGYPAIRHVSSPSRTLQSPLRHHRRTVSVGRPPIRETLDACLTYDGDEDGVQGVRINQYVTSVTQGIRRI